MIPSVFISSTVSDLKYIRDAVRATVRQLALRPVMSDYGEIAYMGDSSAEESCYQSVGECRIMILIIGKRYGSSSRGEPALSVTEREFETAKKNQPYLLTFVDREVFNAKKIYDANPGAKVVYPGMDKPVNTFSFIQKVMDADTNNGVFPFSDVAEVDTILRTQLASLFGRLIDAKRGEFAFGIKDIMGELQAMRSVILKGAGDKGREASEMARGVRFLLEDANREFAILIKRAGSFDVILKDIKSASDLKYFLRVRRIELETKPSLGIAKVGNADPKGGEFHFVQATAFFAQDELIFSDKPYALRPMEMGWLRSDKVMLNDATYDYFNRKFLRLKDCIGGMDSE